MREHEQSEKHRRKVEILKAEYLPCDQLQSVKVFTPSKTVDDQESSRGKECLVCQKSFSGQQSMQEHLNSEKHLKKVSRTLVAALECKPCKKVFSGQESLEEHLKSKKHLSLVRVIC